MTSTLKAPFPYFGGKSKIADLVWQRFGSVSNYVEPFAGSLAILLANPNPKVETCNDKNCYIANFWRALTNEPEEVACYADQPVNEADLHARHLWLVNQTDFRERMMTEPDYYDAKIAGWWVWGASSWIASGWCDYEKGTPSKKVPRLSAAGQGIQAVANKRPHLVSSEGINRQLPHVGGSGRGEHRAQGSLIDYLYALANRLRSVRVCCGDWSRVCTPAVTSGIGLTAVLLDPPYSAEANRASGLYATDDYSVAHDVRAWCVSNSKNSLLRIALCGYAGEHNELEDIGWTAVSWKATGGYGSQGTGQAKDNAKREVIWFSPSCLGITLFDFAATEPPMLEAYA